MAFQTRDLNMIETSPETLSFVPSAKRWPIHAKNSTSFK